MAMKEAGRRWSGLFCVLAIFSGALLLGRPAQAADEGLSPSAQAELQAMIDGSAGETKFTPPGPAIDPSSLKGKLIFTIPSSTAIPFCDVVDKQMDAFAKRLDMRHEVWQTQAQIGQWVQGFSTAFAHNADLINVACGLDPNTVAPQIKEAVAKGIPVVAAHTYALGQTSVPELSGIVYGAYIKAAELETAWVILQTKGKGDVLVITAPSTANSPFIEKAIMGMFAKYCPNCKVRVSGVNAADWASKVGSTVQSAILADRSLDYIIPIYDGMVQFAMPAIITTGSMGRVKIATFNATPAVLDMMRTGNVVTYDPGEDTTWLAGAMLDQDMRVLLKKPLIKDYFAGIRGFTKDNVVAAGTPAKFGVGYGDGAEKGYEALWGLK
jgi:ribose transport system substrate-binding protein